MTVKELIDLLKTFPKDARILVRVEHDASFNPGDEGYEDVWQNGKSIFHCKKDNSVNIQ